MNEPTVILFVMPHIWGYGFDDLQHDERFSKLEHLAEIKIKRVENQTESKYIRGECNIAGK